MRRKIPLCTTLQNADSTPIRRRFAVARPALSSVGLPEPECSGTRSPTGRGRRPPSCPSEGPSSPRARSGARGASPAEPCGVQRRQTPRRRLRTTLSARRTHVRLRPPSRTPRGVRRRQTPRRRLRRGGGGRRRERRPRPAESPAPADPSADGRPPGARTRAFRKARNSRFGRIPRPAWRAVSARLRRFPRWRDLGASDTLPSRG